MKWLNRGISRVIKELERIGRDFNVANPTDKFSAADMIDVANSVVQTLTEYVSSDD